MPWWIATTSPACERRAETGLADAGFVVWLPQRLVRFKSRHMATASERLYPVFPSYLFLDPGADAWGEAWHRVRAIEDVRSILTNDGRPLALGDLEMGRVRAHLDGLTEKTVDAQTWRINDLARIADVENPFFGMEGVVARAGRRGSVSLLLSLFGRQTATEIDVRLLERAA